MIIGIIFLLFQTYFAFFKPKYFLFLYLLFITSFLGFLPKSILIGTNEIGLYYQNILMLSGYLFHFKKTLRLPMQIKILLNGILVFYFFGVVYPVINASSSIMQSIMASKEFSTLFLLHYLIINSRSISLRYMFKVLSFYGFYFILILVVFLILQYIPPHYIKDTGQIEYDFPPILSLFLFISVAIAFTYKRKILVFVMLAVWVLGMYYEGHMAILLTTTLGCLIVLFRLRFLHFVRNIKWLAGGLLILCVVLYFLPTDQLISQFNQTSSLEARSRYNVERWELISEKPLFGYGFLHKSAYELEGSTSYTESLSFIDSGYVDLLGKFGIIGTLIFLSILTIPFFRYPNNIFTISLRIFYLQYFLVNITWSVYSFSVGTIALSLALYVYILSTYGRYGTKRDFFKKKAYETKSNIIYDTKNSIHIGRI